MISYLVMAEDADGRILTRKIYADSLEQAKYNFWHSATEIKLIRIVSVGVLPQKSIK